MRGPKINDPAAWIEGLINDFLNNSPHNSLADPDNERAWEEAVVGFAQGEDYLYQAYKDEHVGPFHWTPEEIFNLSFSQSNVDPEELTVISWILPQREATKADNRGQRKYPSERWARARIYGEQVNVKLRQHVVESLQKRGCQAVAPMLSPLWSLHNSARFGFASTWSERHTAFAAGLGTFGLCDGLITPKGKAMRLGSVVARIQIPPTPRPYTDYHQYCLYFSHGTCKKCIARCPVEALSEAGHDKKKCLAHLKPGTADYVKSNYHFDGYGCGLCQTGVPCESGIPVAKDVAKTGRA